MAKGDKNDPYAWRFHAKEVYKENRAKYHTNAKPVISTAAERQKEQAEIRKENKDKEIICRCGSDNTYILNLMQSNIYEKVCYDCDNVYKRNPKHHGNIRVDDSYEYVKQLKIKYKIKD